MVDCRDARLVQCGSNKAAIAKTYAIALLYVNQELNAMAYKIFNHILNTVQDKLVSLTISKEWFNSWNKQSSSENAFSRKTKLSLQNVFWLIVSRIVQTLPVSLSSFFSQLNLPAPTKSAFSMKRKLIKSSLFEEVNKTLVKEFYSSDNKFTTWKGHVILACDGSRIALPNVPELGENFGYYHTYQGEVLYPCAKAAIFQDTLNGVTVLAKLEEKDTDERRTFEENFLEANTLAGGKTIMTIDRGYFSYLLMYLMIKDKQLFVMKARNTKWRSEFVSSGKKDDIIEVFPSRATAIYRNRQWNMNRDKKLTLRLVRFDHPDGSVDVLVTNIFDKHLATCNEVIDLYRMRWPAETAYGVYKNDMALELFSSFRKDGVLQDFYAAIIMYNLASIMAHDCKRPPKGKKIDMSVAVGVIHILCPVFTGFLSGTVTRFRIRSDMEYLSHCLTEVRPGRSFERLRRKRKTSGKFYRHLNFSLSV